MHSRRKIIPGILGCCSLAIFRQNFLNLSTIIVFPDDKACSNTAQFSISCFSMPAISANNWATLKNLLAVVPSFGDPLPPVFDLSTTKPNYFTRLALNICLSSQKSLFVLSRLFAIV